MDLRSASPRRAPVALCRILAGVLAWGGLPWVGWVPVAYAQPAGSADAAPSAAFAKSASAPPEAPVAGAPKLAAADGVPPFSLYYGLYVGGRKVGFMHTALRRGASPTLSTCLQARVAGMGRTATVTMREERRFAARGGLLQAVDFVQESDGARVRVRGHRQGGVMVLRTEAGGATEVQRVAVDERLADDLAAAALARAGAQPGVQTSARHLDPASQQVVRAELAVQAVEETMLGGVPAATVRVRARYPDLKIDEESTFDGQGKLLAARVGGFFEARLEDEAVAKAEDTVQDVLLGAVVKVPGPLPGVAEATHLRLTFAPLAAEAAEPALPPAARHEVVVTPEDVQVTLRRDAPWQGAYVPPWRRRTAPKLPAEVAHALRPTPYLQSEAPPLRAMARAAVGNANDVGTAVARLCAAVRDRLRPEYVPAFSNALQAYHDRRGDCTEHSALFAALARAAGLPARPVVGIAYWPAGGGFGWHAWDEVWAEGTWRQVDPTWDQPIADVTHVKLAEGGPAEQASVVMLLGRLRLLRWQVLPP